MLFRALLLVLLSVQLHNENDRFLASCLLKSYHCLIIAVAVSCSFVLIPPSPCIGRDHKQLVLTHCVHAVFMLILTQLPLFSAAESFLGEKPVFMSLLLAE